MSASNRSKNSLNRLTMMPFFKISYGVCFGPNQHPQEYKLSSERKMTKLTPTA